MSISNEELELISYIYTKFKNKEELTRAELAFLYQTDFSNKKNTSEIFISFFNTITDERDKKKDLAIVFNCKPEHISLDVNEISSNTVCHYGNLNIGNKQIIVLPKHVCGNLKILNDPYTKRITFPNAVDGSVHINYLPDNSVLPKFIAENLIINDLDTNIEWPSKLYGILKVPMEIDETEYIKLKEKYPDGQVTFESKEVIKNLI